jgi:TRAP-type C4-dicarboxylate transport system permease small subunit
MIPFFRLIQRIEEVLISWSILTIAGLTIANVFSRTLFGESLAFTEELSQFLIIAVTFIGLSYAASRGRHIRMTAIYDQLPIRWRKALMIISSGFTGILMAALAVYSFRYIQTVWFLESVSPVLQVPLYIVYLIVPCGLMLAALQYALAVARNCVSSGVYLSFDVKDEYEQPVVGET